MKACKIKLLNIVRVKNERSRKAHHRKKQVAEQDYKLLLRLRHHLVMANFFASCNCNRHQTIGGQMKLKFPRTKKIHSIPDAVLALINWVTEIDNPLWNFVKYINRNHGFKDALRMARNK